MHRYLLYLTVFLLFANTNRVRAQHVEIDSVMDLSPNYLPTYYSTLKCIEYEPLNFKPIDTGLIYTHYFDPLLKPENMYQDLGIYGQAHKSIIFNYQRDMGFVYQTIPYPLFFKKQSDLTFYKLQTTYSKIAYTFGLPKENEIFAVFVRNIKGVTVAANIYAAFNEGSFLSQTTNNLCGDFQIQYELPNSVYGFRASYIINHLKCMENGGLLDSVTPLYKDTIVKNQTWEVFSPNANSNITTHDFALQNYVNIKNKNDVYFGTFAHDFQIEQMTQFYKDLHDTLNPRYPTYYYSNQATNDSVRCIQLKNAIQWSNFMPNKEMSNKNNFFHIAGGLLHDYTIIRYNNITYSTFHLFARTHIRLFKVMNITANISYAFNGYTNNDVIASAGMSWTINKEKVHIIGGDAQYFRSSPEYFMQHIATNNYLWDTLFRKQDVIHFKLFWNYKKYNVSVNYYYLDNYISLSEALRPMQNKNIGNMVQVSTFIPFRYKHFGTTANLNLQYCTNDVVHVPLFAGKLSVYYIFELLKRRVKILIGGDLMYNTPYYADAYLPVLHTFYAQNTNLTGNFLYCDVNLTVSIDRINFFFRGGNLLSFLMGKRNITTPNYPSNSYTFYLGISWRFFD